MEPRAMTQSARLLVHFTFFYTCVEGLVVNILYPATLPFIYKDIVLVVVYGLVLLPNLDRVISPSPLATHLNGMLVLFAGIMVIYMIAPSPVNMMSELVAIKQRLFYIPLIVVAWFFIRSFDDLKGLVGAMYVYAIGVSLFGIYLFFTGPEGLRHFGADYSAVFYTPKGPSEVTDWRVPGTFTSAGQYGAYLMANLIFIAGLLMTPQVKRWLRVVGIVSVVSLVLAMLVSGSRAPLVLGTAGVGLIAIASGRLSRGAVWALLLYGIFAYGFVVFGPGVQDRIGSIAASENLARFQKTYFGQLFLPSLLSNPLGSGLGLATIGARHFAELYQVVLVESYLGILAVETGWPGLVAFVLVELAILQIVFSQRRVMTGSPYGMLWLALAVYVVLTILILPVSTAIDSAPSNFYFWFAVGALIRLAELEYWRLWELREGVAAENLDGAGPALAPAEP
jgi:hypothetical protein